VAQSKPGSGHYTGRLKGRLAHYGNATAIDALRLPKVAYTHDRFPDLAAGNEDLAQAAAVVADSP